MPQLKAVYEWAKQTQKLNSKIPFSEINTIISSITGIPKHTLLIHSDINLSSPDIKKIKKAIEKRIANYPLQYILGYVEFMGIRFLLNKGVLIPRPETELLVETALKYIEQLQYRTILDLCCGSGVIGLSIAYINKQTRVCLSDISYRAVSLAHKNTELLGLTKRCNIYKGDLFSAIPESLKFDLIVSNPPYVPKNRIKFLQKEISYEPIEAINGGKNGMEIILRVIQQAKNYLNRNGMLMIEHDDTHKKYFNNLDVVSPGLGLKYIKTINDLSGLPRVSVFVPSS